MSTRWGIGGISVLLSLTSLLLAPSQASASAGWVRKAPYPVATAPASAHYALK